MDIKQVGIIGAGTMGNGIAHVFARSGYNVILCDIGDQNWSPFSPMRRHTRIRAKCIYHSCMDLTYNHMACREFAAEAWRAFFAKRVQLGVIRLPAAREFDVERPNAKHQQRRLSSQTVSDPGGSLAVPGIETLRFHFL